MFDELAELINNKSDVLSFQIHSAQELESKSADGPLSFRLPPENAEAQGADSTQQDPEDEQ